MASQTLFSLHPFGGVMQKTLSDARARQELLDRLERLSPDARPLWGRMSAPQMLAHLADWMLMAKGDLNTAAKKRILRYPVVKQLVIYWLPWPKGVPTAPELLGRTPLEWAIERAAVRQHVQSFAKLDPKAAWPDHPAFGKITPRAWGVLGYRHMDHHLRQFGV
ncbi:MAG: DinB family protein [Gemmatimonadaceae bacterium]